MTDDLLPPGEPDDDDAAPRLPVPAKGTRGGARPGAGRPVGAANKVNRDLREYLVRLTGRDAIVPLYQLAAMPVVTDEAALEELVRRFRCTRKEAVELVLRAAALVFPHVYPRLGQLELRPPGAVDAGPVFDWDIEGTADQVEIGDEAPNDSDGSGEALP